MVLDSCSIDVGEKVYEAFSVDDEGDQHHQVTVFPLDLSSTHVF